MADNISDKLIASGKLRMPVLTALAIAFSALCLIFTFILNYWATNERQQNLAHLVEQVDDQIYQLSEDIRYQLLSSASLLAGRDSTIEAVLQKDSVTLQTTIKQFHRTYSSQTLIDQVQIFDKQESLLANFGVSSAYFNQATMSDTLYVNDDSATGLYLTSDGTIYIYAVVAIHYNNEQIGYVQVSKPFIDSVQHVSTLNKANLYLLIEKALISKSAVNQVNSQMGLISHWDVFDKLVLVSPMQGNINLPFLANIINEVVQSNSPEINYLKDDVNFGDLSYNLALFPIHDIDGNYLGRMLLLKDVSAASRSYRFSIIVTSISFGIVMSLIFISFWYFLGRIERNISESERRIILAKNEAEKARDEAEVAKKSAQEASQIKSDFLAKMSHELRTPLNAIIGISEMMYEDATDFNDDNYIEPLERVLHSGKHLLALINDILDLSKIEAGKMELHPEVFDIDVFVTDVSRTCEPLAQKRNNQLTVEIESEIGELYADTTKLRQVLLNLVSNACKFTENGKITLKISKCEIEQNSFIRFAICDTGIGMNKQQLAKLFRDFQQVDSSTTRKYEGTGLGLAISRKLAKLMGGNITVTSELNKGTKFIVTLPTAAQPIKELDASRSDELQSEKNKLSIMIIDDDANMTELLKYHIQRPSVDLTICEEHQFAAEQVLASQVDLVVINTLLHREAAETVVTKLRQHADQKYVIITLCHPGDREKYLELGVDHCLIKPINKSNTSAIFADYIDDL